MVTPPFRWKLWPPLQFCQPVALLVSPNGSPQGDGLSSDTWGNNRAARITPEIMSVSVTLIVSVTQWVAACDAVAEGITSPIKSGDALSRGGCGGGDRCQAIFQVQPRGSRAGQTLVNVPSLSTLLGWVGGKRTAWLSSAVPSQQDGAVQFVQRNGNVNSMVFWTTDWGSQSGWTFSNVDLVCFFFLF